MTEIDTPSIKNILWQKLRIDLQRIAPYFSDSEKLLCPTCLRQISLEEFSIEHIIPRQAVDLDPADVKENITRNQRSGLMLLCRKNISLRGKIVFLGGCNSWKGKYFDKYIKQVLTTSPDRMKFTTRHQVAMTIVGYLALFRAYGYQIALSSAGKKLRAQFFHPNDMTGDMPLNSGMILAGQPETNFDEETKSYWEEPFRFTFEDGNAFIGTRSTSFIVPISRDPRTPVSHHLRYVPPKYSFRPDLTTVFD